MGTFANMIDPVSGERPLCRHCNTKQVTRNRGLCWTCYYLPGVREQYESDPQCLKFLKRGLGLEELGNDRRELDAPTDAWPGTPEKVEVLMERARLGLCLWNPLDAGMTGTL